MRTDLERRLSLGAVAAFAAVFFTSGCWSTDSGEESAQANGGGQGRSITLTGAGATFPYPIYSRWFSIYSSNNPVRVNYQSVGSGGGIRQMIEHTVDFGATDAPLTEEDLARMPGTLSIPTVIGAVVVTYNLPEVTSTLRLDGPTVAAILLGEITNWQDARIGAVNPGVQLPDRAILPVHRSDGSGTTYVFTDFLSAVSPEWTNQVGFGNAVRFPTGLGARGNEGVTGQVRQIPGAIGYVEQVYARQNDLPAAAIMNAAGEFVEPSVEAMTRAALGLGDRISEDNDFRLSIVNASGSGAYPIASWTYLLISPHFDECGKAEALIDLIRWSLLEGEGDASALGYAPIAMDIRLRALDALRSVTCGASRRPVVDPGQVFTPSAR